MQFPSIITRPSRVFPVRIAGKNFNRSELAGASGDLGTLLPFAVGYITINSLNPQGVLLGFGLLAVATGFYFRTPMSVQPMKATVTAAITDPELVTSGAIFVAALATGLRVRLLAFDHATMNPLAAPLGGVPAI